MARLIIHALSKDDRAKFFTTREVAVPWLLNTGLLMGQLLTVFTDKDHEGFSWDIKLSDSLHALFTFFLFV